MELIWLGSGGGRLTTITQKRATGGLVIRKRGIQIHIDPGPGAIVRANQFGVNPQKTNIVMITHNHTDHMAGFLPILEAISGASRSKKSILLASRSCIEGYGENFPKIVNPYVESLAEKIIQVLPGERIWINDILIEGTKTLHEDTLGVGFKITFNDNKTVAILGDTQYFMGLSEYVEGVDLAVFNVLKPGNVNYPMHMSTKDVIKTLNDTKEKPKQVVIQHFGLKMINVGPHKEANRLEKETGVKTIAARDGMRLKI